MFAQKNSRNGSCVYLPHHLFDLHFSPINYTSEILYMGRGGLSLNVFAVLAKDLSFVSCSLFKPITTACNTSSKGSNDRLRPPNAPTFVCAYTLIKTVQTLFLILSLVSGHDSIYTLAVPALRKSTRTSRIGSLRSSLATQKVGGQPGLPGSLSLKDQVKINP